MLINTFLNKVERCKSFIYGDYKLMTVGGNEALVIEIMPRRNSKPECPECPECGKRCKTYDMQPVRLFEYVPIWSFKVFFRYAPRRVHCPSHGIKVEALLWAYGKEQMTISYQVYLDAGQNGSLGMRRLTSSRQVGIASFGQSSLSPDKEGHHELMEA